MSQSIEELLTDVRATLHELGNGVVKLANSHSDIFDDLDLKLAVEGFQDIYKEASNRLSQPALSIAMLGTTSSGKSTIVNALIGRRIAPILNTEMSGGVLRLRASDGSKLVIQGKTRNRESKKQDLVSTENNSSPWETGEWIDLGDEELYKRIQAVMLSYHEIRKREVGILAPQITVWGEVLPANDRSLLNLPSGIDLEFIDLPGLKSVNDRANLRIIQPQVKKACSLVALDYQQVDEEHRQRLLQELKDVIKNSNSRTDSIVFILNRVDLRNSTDFPIEQQIKLLKQEIQTTLSLESLPDVIPFSSLLLYYAQCAWGTKGEHLKSDIAPEERLILLQGMFRDCNGIIYQKVNGDKDLKRWFRDIEDKVIDDGEHIDDEAMRKILHYALEWSGGNQLWNTLRFRIQDSFPQLIIAPILNSVFSSFNILESKISLHSKNSAIDKEREVNQILKDLQEQRLKLEMAIKKKLLVFQKEIENTIKNLKESETSDQVNIAIDEAEKAGIVGYEKLSQVFSKVRDYLNIGLIIPIEEALENQGSVFDLRDSLKENVSPFYADEIARAYEDIKEVGRTFLHDKKSRTFRKSAKMNDEKKINELDKAEQAYRRIYSLIAGALAEKAEFSVQKQCELIGETVQSFVEKQKDQTLASITEVFPDLEKVIESEFNEVIRSNPPLLPEKFFNLSDQSIEDKIDVREEVIGVQTVQETYTKTVFLFFRLKKTRPVEKPIYKDVDYRQLELPDFYAMPDQWRQGIADGESALWTVITIWINDHLEKIRNEFEAVISRAIELTKLSLEERKRLKGQELEEFKRNWLIIEIKKDLLVQCRDKLSQLIYSGS